jgi:acetyl esterase
MLDAELQILLKLTKSNSYSTSGELGVASVRRNVRQLAAITGLRGMPVGQVNEFVIPARHGGGVALRVFRPARVSGALPALLYFHGGGFVLYGVDDFDGFARFLCASAGITVILVEYRLAPEHPFPCQYLDAVLALRWVYDRAGKLEIDADRIAVGGDSVGGNLSAALAADGRGHGVPIFLQLLIYPVLQFSRRFPSYQKYGTGYFLDAATMDWFWALFRNPSCDDMENDRRLCPFLTADAGDLPPVIMVIAEFDILRDEALLYYQRRKEGGGKDMLLYFDNLGHNFVLMAGKIKAAHVAVERIAGALKEKMFTP